MKKQKQGVPAPHSSEAGGQHQVCEAAGHRQTLVVRRLVERDCLHLGIILEGGRQFFQAVTGQHQMADLGLDLERQGERAHALRAVA